MLTCLNFVLNRTSHINTNSQILGKIINYRVSLYFGLLPLSWFISGNFYWSCKKSPADFGKTLPSLSSHFFWQRKKTLEEPNSPNATSLLWYCREKVMTYSLFHYIKHMTLIFLTLFPASCTLFKSINQILTSFGFNLN